MSPIKIKVIRFFLNLGLYAALLISATFYAYTNPPELYRLKEVILPLNNAIFLAVFLALLCAGVNEILSMLMLRIARRNE